MIESWHNITIIKAETVCPITLGVGVISIESVIFRIVWVLWSQGQIGDTNSTNYILIVSELNHYMQISNMVCIIVFQLESLIDTIRLIMIHLPFWLSLCKNLTFLSQCLPNSVPSYCLRIKVMLSSTSSELLQKTVSFHSLLSFGAKRVFLAGLLL